MSDQTRNKVVADIRESLPEFCKRNEVNISDDKLDNLANWIVNSFPSGFYREFCPGVYAIAAGDVEEYACACPGVCWFWREVPLFVADEIRKSL